MGINFNSVSEKVFQILKGHGYSLKIYDEEGTKTAHPEDGRFFYCLPDQVLVSIHDEGEYSRISMYLSHKVTVEEIEKLINQLKKVATTYNLSWTLRNYGKTIAPKDFAHLIKNESRMEFLKQIL